MPCHKMQLESVCIISGFSTCSVIIRYCCHDESLELCRHIFAMLLPSQTSPSLVETLPIFLWYQHKKKKKLWKNIIIIQTQRDPQRDMLKQYRYASVWKI